MSWLMRKSVVIPAGTTIESTGETVDKDLTGLPAGFALTALQQIISFVVFVVGFGIYYAVQRARGENDGYFPKILESKF